MKWVKYVEYVLFIITIACFASLFFLPQVQHMGDMHADCEWMIWWLYGIVGIGIVCALISPVKNLFTSPKAALTTFIGLIVAVILQLFYNYILNLIDGSVVELEDSSITLVDILTAYSKK